MTRALPREFLSLPRRLDAVANLVPMDAEVVVDIGYDHGKLLAHAAEQGMRALGVETHSAFGERFNQRYQSAPWHRRVCLYTGWGLEPVIADTPTLDTIIIAGLTEETMLDILRPYKEILLRCRSIILCPTRFEALLRPTLSAWGLRVCSERLARSDDHLFEVMAFEPGEQSLTEMEQLYGPLILRHDDAKAYFLWRRQQLRDHAKALNRTERALRPLPRTREDMLDWKVWGLDLLLEDSATNDTRRAPQTLEAHIES